MIPDALLKKAQEKGADADFLAWVKTMPSALTGLYGAWHEGEGINDPAHVRRVSHGSGIAEKPPYSAVALTHDEHLLQHQKGEEIFAPKEWWEKEAIRYLTMWINGVKPPVNKRESEKVFVIHHAGQFLGLWLWAKKYFQGAGKPLKVIVKESTLRSSKQNSGMWVAPYLDLVEFYDKHPDAYAKDILRFAFQDKPDKDFVHKMMKALCNDGKSTRIGKNAFSEYFDRMAEYMMKHHNYELKMPINESGNYQLT